MVIIFIVDDSYSLNELNYLPVNTALYSPHKLLKSVYTDPNNDHPMDTDDESPTVTTAILDKVCYSILCIIDIIYLHIA